MSLTLGGCYYDNEEELYGSDTTAVSYSAAIRPMIEVNCATSGCHVANAQSPDLSSYPALVANKDRVKARAVDGSPSFMPVAGPMSQANRDMLKRWIEAGALNN